MPEYSELNRNNRFLVYIADTKLSFSKVSGLGSDAERDVYAEGGANDWPHVMFRPGTGLRSLTLERGVQTNNRTISSMMPGTYIPYIEIIVLGVDGKPYYEYCIEDAWVVKWDISELDAMDGRILIDTFGIDYVKVTRNYLK